MTRGVQKSRNPLPNYGFFIENPYPNMQLLDTTYLPTYLPPPTTYLQPLDTAAYIYLPPRRASLLRFITLPWKKFVTHE